MFFLPFKTPWKFPFFLIHHFEKCNILFHVWTSELFKPYLRNFKKRPNNWRNYFREICFKINLYHLKKYLALTEKKRRKKKSHSISDKEHTIKKNKTKEKKKQKRNNTIPIFKVCFNLADNILETNFNQKPSSVIFKRCSLIILVTHKRRLLEIHNAQKMYIRHL